jgi:hypothetical protein
MSLPENPESNVEVAIASQIVQLESSDPAERARAVASIFAHGCERARRVTHQWFEDGELANCFVREQSGLPRITVGIAVSPPRFERIRAMNGTPRMADVPPDLDAKEFELHLGEAAKVDVLTTRDAAGGGAIARFLDKHGEGIQQVELNVSDVDRTTRLLHTRFGLSPIYPESRSGADGTRVNFFLVADRNVGKLLIELVESPAEPT